MNDDPLGSRAFGCRRSRYGVRKPSAKRQRAVPSPSAALVERMRARLLADRRQRDATLLVVLAYAGLRPQEALALPWHTFATAPCSSTAHRATRA